MKAKVLADFQICISVPLNNLKILELLTPEVFIFLKE